MNAWRQLLIQAVLRHRAQGRLWMNWGLLALLLLPLAGVAFGRLPLKVAGMVVGGLSAGAVLLWWGEFLQAAMRMNTPAAACLVPGLRRRLIALSAVLWCAGSLPPAALFGAATGHFGYSLLISAACLQYIALCGRYPLLAFVPSLVWLATRLPGFPRSELGAALVAPSETVLTVGGLLVLAAVGVAVLRTLFPRGGDAHYNVEACLARQARYQKEGRSAFGGRALFRMLDVIYHARLASPGSPAVRLLDALGARGHWSSPVLVMAVLSLATIAWRAVTGGENMGPFVPLLLVSMMVVVVTHVDRMLGTIKKSRVEQGILRLTPMAPRPRELNRQLALALLKRFGIVWGTYLACSVTVMLATTGTWRAWLFCTILALAFAPLLLRDHARHPGWRGSQVAVGVVMLFMAPLAGVVEYSAVPLAAVIASAVLLLAGTAIALAWRWRRALAAPPAFPAGRMAA